MVAAIWVKVVPVMDSTTTGVPGAIPGAVPRTVALFPASTLVGPDKVSVETTTLPCMKTWKVQW